MRRISWRWLILVAGGFLLIALLLPLLFNLNRFHRQIGQMLEGEFGRHISVGSIEWRLLPQPGLVAEYVTVEEDPDFGAEPFIRAEELSCELNVWSLWKRHLEFSHLAFKRPSINLVKDASGRWNLAAFLEHAGARVAGRPTAPAAGSETSFSSLELDEARINFKVREEKKVYALAAADVRLDRAEGGRWKLQLEATPIRSDRAITEAGTLRLRGELGPLTGVYGELPLAIDLELQKAQLADVLVFFLGWEYGVLGRVEGRAHFSGTPHQLLTEGTAQLSNVHRWDLLAPPGAPAWQFRYRVAIDTLAGKVDLQELDADGPGSRLHAAGSFTPWTTPAKWEIRFAPVQLALQDIFGTYAAFRNGVDADASVSGEAGGALTWSGPGNLVEGALDWQGVALANKELARGVEASRFRIEFTKNGANLPSLSLALRTSSPRGEAETLDMAASWSRRGKRPTLKLHLASRSLHSERVAALTRALGLSLTRSARLEGPASLSLDYESQLGPEPRISRRGWVELHTAHLTSPLLNEPITIGQARLEFSGSRIRIAPLRAQLAGADVTGNLSLMTAPTLSCDFNLDAGQLDADRLDQLLNPRRRGRLRLSAASDDSRALPSTPSSTDATGADFFSRLRARGQLNVARLVVRSTELTNLRAVVNYAARRMQLEKLHFELFNGRFVGAALLGFMDPPSYRIEGQFDRLDLERLLRATSRQADHYSGTLSARASLESTGPDRRQLLDNLTGRGAFVFENGQISHVNLLAELTRAAGVVAPAPADPGTQVYSLSGEFFLAEKRVRLRNVQMVLGGVSASLEGTADLDGRLNLLMTAEPLLVAEAGPMQPPAARQEIFANRYRLVGTLGDPQVARAERSPPRR